MESTQRALLKAIAANPHDDTPRLVYADWLDEHAADLPKKERESTAARAEIIRVQCELARLAQEDCDSRWVYEYVAENAYENTHPLLQIDWSEDDPGLARRVMLGKRERELMKRYQQEWLAECPEITGCTFKMCRGFWTNLSIGNNSKFNHLLNQLEKSPDVIPFEALSVDPDLTKEDAVTLTESPIFQHLTKAGGDSQQPIVYSALAKANISKGIRQVELSCYFSQTLRPFALPGKWKSLRSLWGVVHGDAELTSLMRIAEAKHLSSLESLCIYLDHWRWGMITALKSGVWTNLKRLDFSAFIVSEAVFELAKGTSLQNLRYLHLGHQVRNNAASKLLWTSNMKHLLVLTLEGKMDQLNASMLQKAKRRNLRVLKLSNTSKDDLVALAKCPATHDLELFALPTGRTASAICAFFRAMQMPKLKMLEFGSDDQLTSKAIEAIANCSRLTNLQALTFERANIGDEGASILAKSKYLTKLRYLNLAGTQVTEKGIAVLRKKYPDAVIIPSNQP